MRAIQAPLFVKLLCVLSDVDLAAIDSAELGEGRGWRFTWRGKIGRKQFALIRRQFFNQPRTLFEAAHWQVEAGNHHVLILRGFHSLESRPLAAVCFCAIVAAKPTSRENLPKAHGTPPRQDGCGLDLECDDATVEKAHRDASVVAAKALAGRCTQCKRRRR
jgi:hypothetical protein